MLNSRSDCLGRVSITMEYLGYAWLDTGTHEFMLKTSNFIQNNRTPAGTKSRMSGRNRF